MQYVNKCYARLHNIAADRFTRGCHTTATRAIEEQARVRRVGRGDVRRQNIHGDTACWRRGRQGEDTTVRCYAIRYAARVVGDVERANDRSRLVLLDAISRTSNRYRRALSVIRYYCRKIHTGFRQGYVMPYDASICCYVVVAALIMIISRIRLRRRYAIIWLQTTLAQASRVAALYVTFIGNINVNRLREKSGIHGRWRCDQIARQRAAVISAIPARHVIIVMRVGTLWRGDSAELKNRQSAMKIQANQKRSAMRRSMSAANMSARRNHVAADGWSAQRE